MKSRTFRAEREFGLIVGAVFALLGVWWFYHGNFAVAAYILKRFAGTNIGSVWVVLPTSPGNSTEVLDETRGGDGLCLQPRSFWQLFSFWC